MSFLKYYNVLELENGFTLDMDAEKNTNYIKIFFKKKIAHYLISYKKLDGRISLSSPGVELGTPKIAIFEIL